MCKTMSRFVIGILFSSLASASFADPQSTQGQTVHTSMDYWQGEDGYNAPSGMGQRVSSKAKNGGGPTFTSLGDFLQVMATAGEGN